MSNLTGTASFKNAIRRLETTDPKHPDTWNPNYQDLINNDVYLKTRADQVDEARGNRPSLADRLVEIEQTQESLSPEFQDNSTAALLFAMTQAALAGRSVQALKGLLQQEAEIIIQNRGIVSGCSITRSGSAARNLSLEAGKCFSGGRVYSVEAEANAASVPPNIANAPVTVQAYLYQGSNQRWRLAVTAIGQSVPADCIRVYNITIPANSTDATDPSLNNVTITDVRRREPQFPQLLDNPASVSAVIETLSSNDYRVDIDVVSSQGAPCSARDILTTSRAPNGLTFQLASAADNVRVRYRISKLNN